MIVLGMVFNVAGLLGMAYGTNFIVLLTSRFVMGVGVGLAYPAARRIVILADPDRLGQNLGRMLAADVAGFAVGPAVSAVLVGPFGIAAPFLLIAALTVAIYPLIARTRVAETDVDAEVPPRFAFDLLANPPVSGRPVDGRRGVHDDRCVRCVVGAGARRFEGQRPHRQPRHHAVRGADGAVRLDRRTVGANGRPVPPRHVRAAGGRRGDVRLRARADGRDHAGLLARARHERRLHRQQLWCRRRPGRAGRASGQRAGSARWRRDVDGRHHSDRHRPGLRTLRAHRRLHELCGRDAGADHLRRSAVGIGWGIRDTSTQKPPSPSDGSDRPLPNRP